MIKLSRKQQRIQCWNNAKVIRDRIALELNSKLDNEFNQIVRATGLYKNPPDIEPNVLNKNGELLKR